MCKSLKGTIHRPGEVLKHTFVFVDYTEFNLLLIAEMTDNENLDEADGKELS